MVWSILAAVSLLALLGIRYPLKMLPVLFLELAFPVPQQSSEARSGAEQFLSRSPNINPNRKPARR